jgi:hypothetical protein
MSLVLTPIAACRYQQSWHDRLERNSGVITVISLPFRIV